MSPTTLSAHRPAASAELPVLLADRPAAQLSAAAGTTARVLPLWASPLAATRPRPLATA
ncbi:hypothetical protein [Kitasatospora sp. DSM 101779]|uniref:hypothetical protein n=1 Tax=Kitasatospora sp. DSM 101779 TaxID=2853165 RepID=UPI0021D9647B|nr:hypothetical protein [Kitasatospora sp. DSM 101779]MCU7820554.1 hypothetical protein [Kitasatospora sp. DSM 101779]